MTFIINADTPSDMRDAIVQWLREQASNQSLSSSMARRVHVRDFHSAKSEAYKDAADFIANMTIEPLRAIAPTIKDSGASGLEFDFENETITKNVPSHVDQMRALDRTPKDIYDPNNFWEGPEWPIPDKINDDRSVKQTIHTMKGYFPPGIIPENDGEFDD